jgi:hypothetical protein
MATNEDFGVRLNARADATGEAVVHLNQGSCEMGVVVTGFQEWVAKKIQLNGENQRVVTLLVGTLDCGQRVVVESPGIPLGPNPLFAEIPLIPMQQFAPPARPLRRRRRWL